MALEQPNLIRLYSTMLLWKMLIHLCNRKCTRTTQTQSQLSQACKHSHASIYAPTYARAIHTHMHTRNQHTQLTHTNTHTHTQSDIEHIKVLNINPYLNPALNVMTKSH